MLNLSTLSKIRSHLLDKPGTFRWVDRAELWGIPLIDLYDHLKFLRTNNFTRNDMGRVFWLGGEVSDVRSAFLTGSSTTVEVKPYQQTESFSLLAECESELKKLVFVGLNSAQLQSKLKRSYDHTTIHRAASNIGVSIGFQRGRGIKLYSKLRA